MNTFRINGRECDAGELAVNETVLSLVRRLGLTGTKLGCGEGDCGACTMGWMENDASGRARLRTFNSCIAPAAAFVGSSLLTVEGLAAADGTPHPSQLAMVRHHGSQCGFCTPGIVVSLAESCHMPHPPARSGIAPDLCGNLCRCTGYRPIRDAALEAIKTTSKNLPDLPAPDIRGLPEVSTGPGWQFFNPTTLQQLIDLREEFPDAPLFGGGTELGVDISKHGRRFPVLIATRGITQLRQIVLSGGRWHVGAAATLMEIGEALGGTIPAIDEVLRWFGSRQIRHRATLAGNLATASPIGDFAPLLLVIGGRIELRSRSGMRDISLDAWFHGYRRTALAPGEVITSISFEASGCPHGGDLPRVEVHFEKVSRRREMDISSLSLASRIQRLSTGEVVDIQVACGGMAETPRRLPRIEALLRHAGETDRVDEPTLITALEAEVHPISDLRASRDYRLRVLAGLLRETLLPSHKRERHFRGDHDFAPSDVWPEAECGRELTHESGLAHATGAAEYVDDRARESGVLDAWIVRSPTASARHLRIDASAARAQKGVFAILTASDIPGRNQVGCVLEDEVLLAEETLEYHGQPVALVIGESVEVCRSAAALVRLTYEELPPILDAATALDQGRLFAPWQVIERGDVKGALDRSAHTFSGQFYSGGQEHFYLETHAALARVDRENGLHIESSTQHPTENQALIAQVLGLPRNQVVVESPRMGGGFGGKETQATIVGALAALGAWNQRRPVRLMLDRDEDFCITGKRHPFFSRFNVGHDDAGRILAVDIDLVANAGWSADVSLSVIEVAVLHVDNASYIPNFRVRGAAVRTNFPSNTAFRGFGAPQGILAMEEILDRVARRVGRPSHEVRRLNFYEREGETSVTHYGQYQTDFRLGTIWNHLLETSKFEQRREEILRWNATKRDVRRGLAITPVKYGVGFSLSALNQAGALVLVFADGSVQVNHGGTEMGQGLHTKLLGVVIRELGVERRQVRMMRTRTDKVPNTSATAASSGADLNGAALADACRTLRERLAPPACTLLHERFQRSVQPTELRFVQGRVWAGSDSVPFADVVGRAYWDRIPLAATGFFRMPDVHFDREKGRGQPFAYFAYGAAVAEVEVDGLTGDFQVRRMDVLHDAGNSLNPGIDRGQIEGGIVQGIGWLTREDLRFDERGRLLSHGASSYLIPAFSDAPRDFRVSLLPDAHEAKAIHGGKSTGEPPIMLAISVREALREAVAAFSHPQATAEIDLPAPATTEAIFHAIQKRRFPRGPAGHVSTTAPST